MANSSSLTPATSAFALAAAVAVIFNTVLACTKDAYQPLSKFMGSLSGHNWTTQGFADIILFFGFGVVFMKTGWGARIAPKNLIYVLGATVIISSIGLFAWYALF